MHGAGPTCSTIWEALRFPRRPILPVKQNWQFIAHPTCVAGEGGGEGWGEHPLSGVEEEGAGQGEHPADTPG